jgi:NAD(P)-dependent dehydrogenase (short-subunit alcohol dehydrogenase family)
MKTVLITGANKGIGFETAKQLAQLGYYVYLGSRDKAKGLNAINKLKNLGISNVETIEIDITKINSIKQAKQELETKIEALDVLINNAAITEEQTQKPSLIKVEELEKVFETNFFGMVQTTQQFISLLKKSGEPRIINLSSELGSLTMQSDTSWEMYDTAKSLTAYAATKSAINAFTVALAYEFKDTNFKINSVTPGFTATDLNHFKGKKTVEEGARPIVKYATLANDVPTGKFYKDEGEVPW